MTLKTNSNWLKTLRERLKARTDSEHEQAILRIVIALLVLAGMGFSHLLSTGPGDPKVLLLLKGVSGFLVFSVMVFAAICISPASNVPRRALGMLADAGATTFCVYLSDEAGLAIFGVYLFITFGYGFRFGRAYLFACQVLSLTGFAWILLNSAYWARHLLGGWGLMLSLVVLPAYVSTLLRRIHEARARAEEANRAKSTFLANMSHEMRTPLNGIVGVADLLQTTSMDEQQGELMRLLRHSVSLLRSLVDDVLDISKIEAGRLAIEIVDFDLHATLNGLVHLLRPHARAKGLTLAATVDPAIDYHLRGDPHHLRQVLLNLLSNAVKFTERGEILVAVVLVGETDEGLRVRFEVRDTGIGISEGAQRRIFEQFVQADDSTTRRYGGTGLGTTIAKQLVELMGGAIGVVSKIGAGSTFWFELPLLKTMQGRDVQTVIPAAEPSTALLMADDAAVARIRPLVAAVCGRVETVNSVSAVIAQLRALKQQGVAVSAVLVTGDVDTASKVFESVAVERGDGATAMIYLAATAPGLADGRRLQAIDGVSCLGLDASPRVLRNAIHAATTRDGRETAEIIDLGLVLREQRQPLKILVAEDNLTNQAIIKQLLESAGHIVFLASDGEEALNLYEQERPELALLDFNMPERNGLEVVAAVRMMEPMGIRLPVVILSASVTVEAREQARAAGADEFVGKPYDAANLLQVIDRLARRAVRGQQMRSRPPVVQAAISAPILDDVRLREVERIASDSAFLTKLLHGFCADVELMLKRIETAIASGQIALVTDATHAIKGAALGIGAQQLAARCAAVDEAAGLGQIAKLQGAVAELRQCFDNTTAQLNDYMGKKRSVSR